VIPSSDLRLGLLTTAYCIRCRAASSYVYPIVCGSADSLGKDVRAYGRSVELQYSGQMRTLTPSLLMVVDRHSDIRDADSEAHPLRQLPSPPTPPPDESRSSLNTRGRALEPI